MVRHPTGEVGYEAEQEEHLGAGASRGSYDGARGLSDVRFRCVPLASSRDESELNHLLSTGVEYHHDDGQYDGF